MHETARWWIAAPSGVLLRAPLAVTVDGTELVLFRDRQGRPAAMLDRCPHRGLPLSMGQCHKGRLVCRYHGWEFDHEGVCQRIPSDLQATRPRPMIAPYVVCEQDGYVWVMTAERPDDAGAPEALPLADRRWWQTRVTVPHPFLAVAGQLAVLAHEAAAAGGCQWTETLPSGRQARVLVWPVPVDAGQTRLEVCVERHGFRPFSGRTVYRADLPLPLGLQALQVSDTYSGPAAVET